MPAEGVDASISRWGNGPGVRLNNTVAKAAGVTEGTRVRIVAEPGRIIIETTIKEKSLSEMLESFSLELHGGELMPTHGPMGKEII